MKVRPLFRALAAALLLSPLVPAHAVATLSFSVNGGVATTCADGDFCDANGAAGVVTFIDDLGPFLINVTTGISKPVLTGNPDLVDLNSVNVQTGPGANTLEILFSDTGFTQLGAISGIFGGTLSGGAASSITATGFASATDTLFATDILLGTIGPFGPGPFSGSFAGALVASSPYSLTQRLFLSTAGPTTFSGDFALQIPEPGTLALAGLALLALGAATRRRKQ